MANLNHKEIVNRYERLQRLRNYAISENNFTKVYQANRLIQILTKKLNSISYTSFQIN